MPSSFERSQIDSPEIVSPRHPLAGDDIPSFAEHMSDTRESEGINYIERSLDGPQLIQGPIAEDCIFENTGIGGMGAIVIDRDFLTDIKNLTDTSQVRDNFEKINDVVKKYFYSGDKDALAREDVYRNSVVTDEDGMVIGTRMSSLKGRNIAKCSEKSIAGYIALRHLRDQGEVSARPSLLTTELSAEGGRPGPHACILLDSDDKEYPKKHLLLDLQNPALLERKDGERAYILGLFALTDSERQDIVSGKQCSPKSLYNALYPEDIKDAGPQRFYGFPNKET